MTIVIARRQSALPYPAQRVGTVRSNQTSCVYDPALWDLDVANFGDALHAKTLCGRCPLLQACDQKVAAENPRCQIVAGRAFTHSGVELIGNAKLLTYINRVTGQKLTNGPDADPLESVAAEIGDGDFTEVETASGMQYAMKLGA